MNRTKLFAKNSISTGAYQICLIAYGFIVPKMMMIYYGSEINGLVSSINQIITYLNLVEAGLAGAAVFALYKPLADKDYASINGIVSAAKKYYYQSGLIFTVLIVGVAFLYPVLKPVSSLSYILVALLVLVLGAKGFLEFFTLAKYRALLTADQRTYVISNTSSIYIILNTAIIWILANLRVNIVLTYFVALFSLFVRTFLLIYYSKRNYPFLNASCKPMLGALDKRWDAFFLQILGAVHSGAPIVIATVFFPLSSVSVYAVYNTIMIGINNLLSIFTSGLAASFGDVIARKDYSTLNQADNEFQVAYYVIISIIYSVAFSTIMPFVKLYTAGVHDANYIVPQVGFAIVVNGFLFNLKTPQGMLVISAGHYRETRTRSLLQAILAVLCGVMLIPRFGLAGIAMGSCLSNIYRDIDLAFYVPKHITNTLPSKTIKRMIWAAVTCIVSTSISSFISFETSNFFQWILLAFAIFLMSSVVTISSAFLFERETVFDVIKRISRLLKR